VDRKTLSISMIVNFVSMTRWSSVSVEGDIFTTSSRATGEPPLTTHKHNSHFTALLTAVRGEKK